MCDMWTPPALLFHHYWEQFVDLWLSATEPPETAPRSEFGV